ncbi:MAG: DUF3237 domain-containing protein [Rubrivivax sp.]|nr:DUF3237 domain-containing protein [Rubrivivax sp.]
MSAAATPPPLSPFATVRAQVGDLVSLGDAPAGERRCVALLGGTVEGPGLQGVVLPGGSDWQWRRADGVLEIDAHYIVRTPDGALVEVRSQGLRHGPPEVMAALARGEPVPPDAYFFRTLMRFTTGAPAWQPLNRVLAVASGRREAREVLLQAWAIG